MGITSVRTVIALCTMVSFASSLSARAGFYGSLFGNHMRAFLLVQKRELACRTFLPSVLSIMDVNSKAVFLSKLNGIELSDITDRFQSTRMVHFGPGRLWSPVVTRRSSGHTDVQLPRHQEVVPS